MVLEVNSPFKNKSIKDIEKLVDEKNNIYILHPNLNNKNSLKYEKEKLVDEKKQQ